MNAVEVRNVSFNYRGAFVFNNLNFGIKSGSFVTILGRGGSGKSTLFKIFSGDLNFDGSIVFFNKSIKYNLDKGYLGFISSDLNNFKKNTVIDELIDVLKFKGTPFNKIKGEIERVARKIRIVDILNCDIKSLNIKKRILVMFALQFLMKPKVLIIDNAFSYLDNEKLIVKREIRRLCKKCTVINITNDVNECLWGDEVIFLGDKIALKKKVMLDVNDFSSNDLDIPFIISLSEKLKFYGLTDGLYFDMERLVDDLWQ